MKDTKLSTPEFNTLIQGFEKAMQDENKAEDHVSEHTSYIREFLSYIEENGIRYVKGITQTHINDYVSYLHEHRLNQRAGGTLEETTINKHKNSIRKFWKYLNSEDIKTNAILLKQKKTGEQEEPTVLTHEEIIQLFSVCDTSAIGYRDKAMLCLYYGCGMRKGEGLRLQLTDFDFGKGRIHVRKSKNNRERYVVMSPKVQEHIEEYIYSYRDFYLAEQSTYEDFFIGERGTPIQPETLAKRIEALWNRVKERYGNEKHIGMHTLRHSLGTHLYMAKMDIEMIALMLGHRTLEATQLYIHSANSLKSKNSNEQI